MHAKLQRRQTLADTRRALVLDAARAVFAEAGIEGASIREIAKKAGYTPGAIYSYFESKEAIYAALLDESLLRLQAAVAEAKVFSSRPDKTLAAKAQAWFDFYAANPRDLDLGFYLVHGMRPRGLTSELDHELNDRLYDALHPCEEALRALGLGAELALQENTALFAHGVGLLLMQYTGRIRMFRQSADALFKTYLAQLTLRSATVAINEDAAEPAAAGQPDLFGGTVQPNSTDT
ncbi:TetR/AcrR family transcriptional regulator [Variovorax sp. KBW07]|uniref:TetR/AcrR family transcriptional regulator n=1 Tax=Variovorax sp. KBW07 TaxID=2153358 RepID=UPI000F5891E5|nr:TetR/AcrR family transcriptional regulator [Variovorax sp. KBW07]RQO46543.1 TetR/AcrR family transcriptional regulator [Variovorax sp. KBW07]